MGVLLDDVDPPTPAQIREIKSLRRRDGIPLTNLPRTKEQAIAELGKYRTSRNDYVIRNRKGRVNPEKRYAAELQRQIEENRIRLREEFLEREARRRAAM